MSDSIVLPKYLYHGFDYRKKDAIEQKGLQPRNFINVASTWPQVPSADNLVYLTNAWAMYYSLHACKKGNSKASDELVLAIAEIEVDLLDKSLLRPDEDFVFELHQRLQTGQGVKNSDWDCSMRKRCQGITDKLSVRQLLPDFTDLVANSLQALGTLGYEGRIPPRAIKTKLFPLSQFNGDSVHVKIIVQQSKWPSCLHFTQQGAGMIAITNYLFGHGELPTRAQLKKPPYTMPHMGF